MVTSFKDNKIILEFDVGNYYKDLVDLLSMIEIANKSKADENDTPFIALSILLDGYLLTGGFCIARKKVPVPFFHL